MKKIMITVRIYCHCHALFVIIKSKLGNFLFTYYEETWRERGGHESSERCWSKEVGNIFYLSFSLTRSLGRVSHRFDMSVLKSFVRFTYVFILSCFDFCILTFSFWLFCFNDFFNFIFFIQGQLWPRQFCPRQCVW